LILSDINGCNEIVEDKKYGLLVPAADPEILFKAMKSLSNNAIFRKEYRVKLDDYIHSNFVQEEVWPAIDLEYEKQTYL